MRFIMDPQQPQQPQSGRADGRIRMAGVVAAVLIALAGALYYFGDRGFSPAVIVLLVLAGVVAVVQTVLVMLDLSRNR